MAIRTGISASFGVVAQVDYDTPGTVNRFYEFNSETLKTDVGVVESTALGRGRFLRTDRRKAFIRGGNGNVVLPVMNKGFGLIFEHWLGENTVTGGGAAKTHTITRNSDELNEKSLTAQVVKAGSVDGEFYPFTFNGCKITAGELAAALDGELTFTPEFDAKTVVTDVERASPSYPSTAEKFIFTEGVLSLDGNDIFVSSFTTRVDNALNTNRRGLGNVKREPSAAGLSLVTGRLDCEFEDQALYEAWVNGDLTADLELMFELATVIPTTATAFSLQVAMPEVVFNGDMPNVGGPDVVMNPVQYQALYNGTDPDITLVYTTSDTAS